MPPRVLPRYLATWSDGVRLVVMANTLEEAAFLAVKLTPPAGVTLTACTELEPKTTSERWRPAAALLELVKNTIRPPALRTVAVKRRAAIFKRHDP
jgi:hypothetical protein